MEYPSYKRSVNKLPKNGWHCKIDDYDFKRDSKAELITALESFFKETNQEGDAPRLVELTFCHENTSQCEWGNLEIPQV